jgi:hypothetical protein
MITPVLARSLSEAIAVRPKRKEAIATNSTRSLIFAFFLMKTVFEAEAYCFSELMRL